METFFTPTAPMPPTSQTRLDLSVLAPPTLSSQKSLFTYTENEVHRVPVRIGDGAFSRVYSGVMQTVSPFGNAILKPVAIKRNLISKHSEFTGSLREMDIHSRVKYHPFIVDFIDTRYGSAFTERPPSLLEEREHNMKDDSVHFLYERALMDLFCYLYECEDKDKIRLPPFNVKKGLMQMMLSIEYLHNSNIIHRDIKPANFLLASSSKYGDDGKEVVKELVAKLCDFGMSKPYAPFEVNTPRVVTYKYRSPEILLNQPYNHKIDVWSMGCVVYEILINESMIKLKEESTNKESPPCEVPINVLGEIVKHTPFAISEGEKALIRKFYPAFKFEALSPDQRLLRDCTLQDDKLLFDLLSKMLAFTPSNRYSITQCLDAPYFKEVRKEIEFYRLKGSMPANRGKSLSSLQGSKQKAAFVKFLNHIHNSHKRLFFPWFSYRIFYHTIDLGCRFLFSIEEEKDEEDLSMPFLVCLYASLKYFIPTGNHLEFTEVAGVLGFGNVKNPGVFAEFEQHLIEKVWKRELFCVTDYELAKKPIGVEDVDRMLRES